MTEHDSTQLHMQLGSYQDQIQTAFKDLRDNGIMGRIWQHDHTVWQDESTEIDNRLGWLNIMDAMQQNVERMVVLRERVREEGYTHVLLLGMGGSSLAPEVFSNVFGTSDDGLQLAVLDSTDPGAVLTYDEQLDLTKTLFIVATKSGGTAETLSFFKYFYNRVLAQVDNDLTAAGRHFIAITDPNSRLEKLAEQYRFRASFLNDPNIGGRYSVLSYFGLVPAALLGIDVAQLLQRASKMAVNCDASNCPFDGDNAGGRLGAIMGSLAQSRRDKVTLVLSPQLDNFGDWVEQLVAESTGKAGKGILPVVGEPLGAPDVYSDDRLFVYVQLAGDNTHDAALQTLHEAGHPVVRMTLNDRYDLGGHFFLWEMATAVASYFLQIHPFNQPNVESAKKLANQMIAQYQETGKLPELDPALNADGITVYGDVQADNPAAALNAFIQQAANGAYIALQAYIQPTETTTEALTALRIALRDKTRLATTLGYGPRFLHSTGQLHKGDAGKGLFIQFTATMPRDADIPDTAGQADSGMTFGTLKLAQALGDRQALLDANRHVIRFDLGDDVTTTLQKLTNGLS